MPTVAYNALALQPQGTGVQTYIREILTALRGATGADMVAVVQSHAAHLVPPGVDTLGRRPSVGVRRAAQGMRSVGPADLVHGLDVDLPLRPSGPTVVTVHDLSVFDVPWTFSRWRAWGERRLVRQAIVRADAVIAVSSFTAERVRHHFGVDSTVVLEGAPAPSPPAACGALADLRGRLGLPEDFVLHVGSPEGRKDLATLAGACRSADLPLVLAGPATVDAAPAFGAIGLGYVATEDLPLLYAAATAVGYPSLYEGFGLPPLEAMSCGAPVVASCATSLPEVLGDGAALVPPGDVGSWAATLSSLAQDPDRRAQQVAAGAARVRQLSWSAAAEGTLDVYRRLGVPA